MKSEKIYTPNGLYLTKSGRLHIPCKFNDIRIPDSLENKYVVIVAYGGRINLKKVGKVIKEIEHNYGSQACFLPPKFSTIKSYEIELLDGTIVSDIYNDQVYPLTGGELEDILNFIQD